MAITDALQDLAMQVKQDIDDVHWAGVAEGQKAERDAFWGLYQNYGNRGAYQYAFSGYGFSFDNFYPMYDIKPTGSCAFIFFAWENRLPNQQGSLTERLNECSVVFDSSNATNVNQLYSYSKFTEVPETSVISATASSSMSDIFRGCNRLTKIEKIVVNTNTTYNNWFKGATALSHIRVDGTIANNINFQDCKVLSGESAFNICEHLLECGNGDEQTPAGTYTVYFHANTWTALGNYLEETGFVSSLDDYGGVKEWLYAWRGWNGA